MPFFIDQLSDNIFLPQPPSRIISLVPSQTELLFHLGLGEKIVGVTKYCVHPKQAVKTKTKIGGTKNFDLELIQALQPDLIIGNKEENYLVGIMQLKEKYPVWMSDIFNLPDALAMIKGIGQITQTQVMANNLGQAITQEFAQLSAYGTIPAAYFIWRKPYMGVGNNTFIHEMLKVAGFQNVFGQVSRYPAVTSADLVEAAPQVIFLSSEPYPFKEKHIREIQEILPQALVRLVDGELFSWYGSRLLHTPEYLKRLRQEVDAALTTN